jgi:hypothetical protein
MLEELNDVVWSLYQGWNDPVLEGEPHKLSQVHILLVVVSPIQLILCGVELINVS